ncbi:MAG: VOC family protein [Pseudomonadota bacterium]
MNLKRLGHILLHVKDIQRSKSFYTGMLGFHVLEEDPTHNGVVFMGLGEHSHTVDLVPTPDGVAPHAPSGIDHSLLGFGHVAFAVDSEEDSACFCAFGTGRTAPCRSSISERAMRKPSCSHCGRAPASHQARVSARAFLENHKARKR